MAKPERFWTGKIETPSHAAKVVKWAGVAFAIIGALPLAPMLSSTRFDPSMAIVTILLLVPALALLKTGSIWAVRGLIVAYALGYCAAALAFGFSLMQGEVGAALGALPLLVIWTIPLFALDRTYKAAKVLRLSRQPTVPIEVFD